MANAEIEQSATEDVEKRAVPRTAGEGIVSLLASRELRWVRVVIVSFLAVAGITLVSLGAFLLYTSLRRGFSENLTSGVVCLIVGLLVIVAAFAIDQLRKYFSHIQDVAVATIKSVELRNIREDDFEKLDKIQQLRNEKAQVDFERNIADAFLIRSFELSGVDFFGEGLPWHLRPGVNVLLGRNGYGKSLILRSLAALLQRNENASRDLFASAPDGAFLQITVERNGVPEQIRRERLRFTESPGKIPILAIPDSRYVNRSDTAIEAPKGRNDDALDLRVDGAWHFIEDRPYGEMMRMLFNELCFDYLERPTFDQPAFALLEGAIEKLTGDRFRFHAVERVGRNAFRLLVLTEGNDRPLPIQRASQGTLSVLGVVGVVRSYLKALFPETRKEEFLTKPAIVLVDELDAHLHPLWQQKLAGILRDNFPNVQFILSAHSPLVVSGCWSGEVAVLQKISGRFVIKQIDRDFLVTPVEEIYKEIFGVEDPAESYLRSASRATSGFSHQERISELEKKPAATELERRELTRLIREEGMIRRASESKTERQDDQERIVELKAKIEALEDELKPLKRTSLIS